MPRVKRGNKRRLKRKKVLGLAKGFYQGKSKLYRYAKEAVDRAQKFAYVGRKRKKRDFRSLWIIRINAAARINGLSYSRLIHGLALAGVEINRKMLAEMAVRDPQAFAKIADQAKNALENGASGPDASATTAKAAEAAAEAEAEEKAAEAEAEEPEAAAAEADGDDKPAAE